VGRRIVPEYVEHRHQEDKEYERYLGHSSVSGNVHAFYIPQAGEKSYDAGHRPGHFFHPFPLAILPPIC
jgi:hypothetical protein